MSGRVLSGLALAGAALAIVAAAAARRRRREAGDPAGSAAQVAAFYDRGAAGYDRAMDAIDRVIFAGGRRRVAGRAAGAVLEIAAGTGRNLPYYPPGLRLTLVDVSPAMLDLARRRAAALGRDVEVCTGDAQALDFAGGQFDTVVCTLGLCTIPDERRAVREAWRVLREGGRLVLLEHVASTDSVVRLIQRLLDPIVCLLLRDHLLRDPLPIVRAAGFEIERVERHALGIVQCLVARRPVQAEGHPAA